MTLLIACLLIYQFDMPPWLYVAAGMVWIARIIVMARLNIAIHADLAKAISAAKDAARGAWQRNSN